MVLTVSTLLSIPLFHSPTLHLSPSPRVSLSILDSPSLPLLSFILWCEQIPTNDEWDLLGYRRGVLYPSLFHLISVSFLYLVHPLHSLLSSPPLSPLSSLFSCFCLLFVPLLWLVWPPLIVFDFRWLPLTALTFFDRFIWRLLDLW